MSAVPARGPWMHRFLIYFFTVVLVVLIYWTLSFLLDDVGNWSPPDYAAIVSEHVPQDLTQQAEALTQKLVELQIREKRLREQQSLLREGTDNSQRTMQQMAERERLRLQKGEQPTPEQQQVVAQAEQLFLRNQQEYQLKNEELAQLQEEQAQLNNQLIPVEKEKAAAERVGAAAYQKLFESWTPFLRQVPISENNLFQKEF